MSIKTKKITITFLGILLLLCVCFISVLIFGTNAKAQSVFQENYTLYDTIQIPDQTFSVNGKSVEAKFIVENPNGTTSSANSQTLNYAGKWKVLYYANYEGEFFSKTETFNVQIPLTSASAEQNSAVYQKAPINQNVEGLTLNIASGSETTINSVIDLKDISGKQQFISFYVMPSKIGQKDCGVFKIVLEDIYNEENFVEITVNEAVTNSKTGEVGTFVKARASSQSYSYAYEYGLDCSNPDLVKISGGYGLDSIYGFYTNASFTGENFGNDANAIKLGYDYKTKTVYCFNGGSVNSGSLVISLDDGVFGQKWQGFSSDFVRLKISGDSYAQTSSSIMITSVKGINLYESTVDVTALSAINIDFGDSFGAENYPQAIIGKPYKIFTATSNSVYTEEKISVNVYTGYGSSAMANVPIEDGCFVPQNTYIHTIVYTCTDAFENKTQLLLPITVNESASEISFTVDKTPITLKAGEYFDIPVISDVTGYAGEFFVYKKIVYSDGTESDLDGLSEFQPDRVGNASLVITVKDYVNNEITEEIALTVNASEVPIFARQPELPIRYIVGGKYEVPCLTAFDYSSGKREEKECSVKIFSDGKNNEIIPSNGYFIARGEIINLVYYVVDKNGKEVQKEFSVYTVDTGLNGEIDKSKYFITENGVTEENDSYVSFSASNASAAKTTFINKIYGSSLSFEFFVEEEKSDFDSIGIELSDVKDQNKKIVFNIGRNEEGIVVLSANGISVQSVDNSVLTGHNIKITLENNKIQFSNTTLTIEEYTDGTVFNGFDGYVSFSMILNNAGSAAEVRFIELFGQIMMKQPLDIAKPNVVILREKQIEASLNQIVTIGAAVAFDVLNPYTELSLTVKSPSGAVVTSEDGVRLQNVNTDREYQILFSEYGKYSVEYVAVDGNNNKRSTKFFITCADVIAPKILIGANSYSVKVNQEVEIPRYTVTDNCSAEQNITVMVQIIDNKGVLFSCTDGKFTPDAVGKWTVRIVALDESYNMAYREIEYIVRRG